MLAKHRYKQKVCSTFARIGHRRPTLLFIVVRAVTTQQSEIFQARSES